MSLTIEEAISHTNTYFTSEQFITYSNLKTIKKLYNMPAVRKDRDHTNMSLYFECVSYDRFIDFQSDISMLLNEVNKNCPYTYNYVNAATVYRIINSKTEPILSVDLRPSFKILSKVTGYDTSAFKIRKVPTQSNLFHIGDLHADRPSSMDGASAGSEIPPPDLEEIPIEPQHVPQQVKSYSLWPHDLKTASHVMMQCPAMPILIPVNSTANTIIDIVSLGELSKMTRAMRIWAGNHTYSNATQVVQYGFKTAMTIINDLVIGLAAERKSSYEVDELQIINWRDLNPVENTISIDLKLAAVDDTLNIPNRYLFQETVADGTKIPTIVLMTRIPVQNTYANDNVSINIIRSSKFANNTGAKTAFIFTADNLAAGNISATGLITDNKAFSSTPTPVSDLLRLDPNRPFNITLDGSFGDFTKQNIALPNALPFPTDLDMRYDTIWTLPQYITTLGAHTFAVRCITHFGSSQTIPLIAPLTSVLMLDRQRLFKTVDGDQVVIEYTNFLASGYQSTDPNTMASVTRSGLNALGAAVPPGIIHLQELSGLEIPSNFFSNCIAHYDNGNINMNSPNVSFDGNPDYDAIQSAVFNELILNWTADGWSVTFKQILTPTGFSVSDPQFVYSTSGGVNSNRTNQALGSNNNTISVFSTPVFYQNRRIISTNVTEIELDSYKEDIRTSHYFTLSHPTLGVRNILAWTRTQPRPFIAETDPTSYVSEYASGVLMNTVAAQFNGRGASIYNMTYRRIMPLDPTINSVISTLDFTTLATRVLTINNNNTFTLDPDVSRLNFPLTLPSTLTETIALSEASSEVTDQLFLYAWKNFLRASNMLNSNTFVYFTLWNKLSTQPIAYAAYSVDYETFFLRNSPVVLEDHYRVYPKSTAEDVLIGNVQVYNTSVGLTFSTITSRWTSRIVEDTSALGYDGYKLTTAKTKRRRVVVTQVPMIPRLMHMESGTALVAGIGGFATGIAGILAQLLQSNQVDNRLKMVLESQLQQLEKQHQNDKDMEAFKAELNGLRSGVNQRNLTTSGNSYNSVPPLSQSFLQSTNPFNQGNPSPDLGVDLQREEENRNLNINPATQAEINNPFVTKGPVTSAELGETPYGLPPNTKPVEGNANLRSEWRMTEARNPWFRTNESPLGSYGKLLSKEIPIKQHM